MLCESKSVVCPMRAEASAASVPAWPPPTTMTSNLVGKIVVCLDETLSIALGKTVGNTLAEARL